MANPPGTTPGPWVAGPDGFLIFDRDAEDDNALIIADLLPMNEYGENLPTVNDSDDIREANAALIASAPDLLEACETLLNYVYQESLGSLGYEPSSLLESLYRGDGVSQRARSECRAILAARAAISKAGGEQS